MIFQPISSGSSGNLYLVSDEERTLAIECGLPFAEMRKKLKYRMTGLDGILISHCHADHARALKKVLEAAVDVYALEETYFRTKREMELRETPEETQERWNREVRNRILAEDHVAYLESQRDKGRRGGAVGWKHHNAHFVKPLVSFVIKDHWHVLPFDLRHDVPTLGFLVQSGSEKLLYITDTASVPYRFSGLTIIAIEANYSEELLRDSVEDMNHKLRSLNNHMSIERVLSFLKENDMSSVREIHLLHLSEAHSDAHIFKSVVEAFTGKPVYVAKK